MPRRGIRLAAAITLSAILAIGAAAPERAPAPVEPLRKKALTSAQYRELRDAWRTYANAHPNDGHAWAELAKVAGYAGDSCGTTRAYAERAYRLNPDDPEACSQLAMHRWSLWCGHDPDPTACIRLLEHAIAKDPDYDDARIRLWVSRLAKGDRAAAEAELVAMLDRGRIPEALADFAYNELVGLEPNAVLFTNGDSDTYPAIALQAGRKLRPDVVVVNLSMLNSGWYRRLLREGPRAIPAPLLNQDPAVNGWSETAMLEILRALTTPESKRPVYFMVTVPVTSFALANELSLEGIVYRVLPGRGTGMQVDTALTERNLSTIYRLQSATSPALDWNEWTLGTLMTNYAASNAQLAQAKAKAGDRAGADRAMSRAFELLSFHHSEYQKDFLATWKRLDPGSPDLARWTRRLKL